MKRMKVTSNKNHVYYRTLQSSRIRKCPSGENHRRLFRWKFVLFRVYDTHENCLCTVMQSERFANTFWTFTTYHFVFADIKSTLQQSLIPVSLYCAGVTLLRNAWRALRKMQGSMAHMCNDILFVCMQLMHLKIPGSFIMVWKNPKALNVGCFVRVGKIRFFRVLRSEVPWINCDCIIDKMKNCAKIHWRFELMEIFRMIDLKAI